MLLKTVNYHTYEQAGYNPQFYAFLSSDVTKRCFLLDGTSTEVGGTGLWDGSRYVGDGGTYGNDSNLSQIEPLLLDFSAINLTTAQTIRGLLSSLAASHVGHVSATFDNTTRFFTNIVSGEASETFIGYDFEIRQGFQGLAYGDQIPLFQGTVRHQKLTEKHFRIVADAISSTLYDVYELPKSSLYTNPAQNNQAIPIIIGDMTENSAIDEDGDGTNDAGPIPLTCIDTSNDVWAMACHAILTEANGNTISLYDDDGLISSGDYTVTTSGDYESVGQTIAYVTFSVAPTGTVTGKYSGAIDSSGALITNPVECLEKILSIMGDDTEFDTTSYYEAKTIADDYNYTCAGFILADQPKSHWVSDVMGSFLGSWYLNQAGKLIVQFDTGAENYLMTAGDFVQAHTTSTPVITELHENIITRPILNYALSGAKVDRRYKEDVHASYLMSYADTEVTGDVSQPFDLNWTRNTATVELLAARIETVYANGVQVFEWKTHEFENVHVQPLDFIAFSCDLLLDSDGNDLENQVGRVINIQKDCMQQELSITFYNTGNFLLAEPDLWNGATRYVGDGLPYGGGRLVVGSTTEAAGVPFRCKFYLPSDTYDGDTTFTDLSANAHTVTINASAVTHSTTQEKFGATSIYINQGDLLVASHADFDFGSSDLTIDFWVYPVSFNTNGDGGFLGINGAVSASDIWIRAYLGNVYFYFGGVQTNAGTLSNNTWTHLALIRYGNAATLYKNGVVGATYDCTGVTLTQGPVTIGYNEDLASRKWDGYLDEIRIIKGMAEHITPFTPPTDHYYI